MGITGNNRIAGASVGSGGPRFRAANPATGGALDPVFEEADAALVDRAFREAAAAFTVYARIPVADRARFLRAIADELMSAGDTLLERAHVETALPLARLENERGRTVNQFRLFASVVDDGSWVDARIDGPDAMRTPPKPDVRTMLVPLGPIAVFGASNFPLAFSVPGGDTASALAAGCTIVCKAHPAHPGTSELAARAIDRAARATGVPAGVFSLLHGWSHDIGLAMVRHPFARAVGFTGSLRGGRALYDAAAARAEPIPVYAEMGSINPVFLLPSALAERSAAIAQALATSINQGVGQFCTNPGVLVGMRGEAYERLQQELAERIDRADHGTMLYTGLADTYAAAIDRTLALGATRIAPRATVALRDGAAVAPTLLCIDAATFADSPALREEMFGPVSLCVTASDARELERVAAALEGQLTATIHGTEAELSAHEPLIELLQRKVGRLIFNGVPTGVEVGHAMHHGGPYPASTDVRSTSVGSAAILRFARPVCYQDFPDLSLPLELRNRNEHGIWRQIDGERTRADVSWAGAVAGERD